METGRPFIEKNYLEISRVQSKHKDFVLVILLCRVYYRIILLHFWAATRLTMIFMPLYSWYSVSNIQTEYFLSKWIYPYIYAAAVRFGCQWCKLRNCDVIQICRGWISNLNSGSIGFGGTSWGLETLNLFWLLDSHPWLFSDQPMQRGTHWSGRNLCNDNIGTFFSEDKQILGMPLFTWIPWNNFAGLVRCGNWKTATINQNAFLAETR